jgi:hypothetical protein
MISSGELTIVVLLDLAVQVEAHHVVRVNLAREYQELCQALLLCLFTSFAAMLIKQWEK